MAPPRVPSLRRTGLVLVLGLLLGPSLSAQAQEPGPQFGIALGLNLATLDAPAAETSVRRIISGGVVARMAVAGPFSVQGELTFNQKGATVEANGDAIRYGVGYVDLPLLLHVKGPSLGPVALYGLAGGFGGLKVFERQRAGGDLSLPLRTRAQTSSSAPMQGPPVASAAPSRWGAGGGSTWSRGTRMVWSTWRAPSTTSRSRAFPFRPRPRRAPSRSGSTWASNCARMRADSITEPFRPGCRLPGTDPDFGARPPHLQNGNRPLSLNQSADGFFLSVVRTGDRRL